MMVAELSTPTRLPTASSPPHRVARPVMLQEWRDVAFLHWRAEPAAVQRLLPPGLAADTHDGSAWVGLVAFRMVGIRAPGLPGLPYLGTFPETNVRTYVRDASGRPGVWFHSLEATRLVPVLTARAGYSLPYMWARMSINHGEDTIRYTSRRTWPSPKGIGGVLTIRPQGTPHEPDELDAFLTARWGLYSTTRSGKLRYAPVEHPAWPIQRAEAVHVRDSLIEAAGYDAPEGRPHVCWSPGVPVRIGLPRWVD